MLYLLYVLVKQDCYIHQEVCVMGEYPSLPNCEFHFSHCCLREKLQVIFILLLVISSSKSVNFSFYLLKTNSN